jgi:hypothetical protein
MKDNQDSRMDGNGWADIGYNFLLCNDNDDQQQIYRGRGWTYNGAHCIGYNFRSLGKNEFRFENLEDKTNPLMCRFIKKFS